MRVHRVVIGLIAGLIVGSVLGGSHSGTALRVADFFAPIGQIWVNAIRMTIVPLVVSMLFVSVAARDESVGLRQLGVVTVSTFVGLLVFAAIYTMLLVPPLIDDMKLAPEALASLRSTATAGAQATATQAKQLPGFSAWVTSLVPANVVKAIADGAMLPVIVFTFLFALASRSIDVALRQSLIQFFGAIANATTTIVDWIIALAPIGIFALVVSAASRAGVALAGAMAYYVIAISAAFVLFALMMYPVASVVGRLPLGWFTRGVLPAQALALSSSSSLASLPALVEGARALGMPAPIMGFVLPLSVSVFKVGTPIAWLTGILFLAKLYGVALGSTAVVTIVITSVVLSFSIPGVPQGALLMLTPLLVPYGIPPEGIALLIAADTIPDLFATMSNVTGDFVVAAVVAKRGVAESVDEAASSGDA